MARIRFGKRHGLDSPPLVLVVAFSAFDDGMRPERVESARQFLADPVVLSVARIAQPKHGVSVPRRPASAFPRTFSEGGFDDSP